jgi:hypothetical protein
MVKGESYMISFLLALDRHGFAEANFDIAIVEKMSAIHDDGMPAMLRTYFGMLPDVEAN